MSANCQHTTQSTTTKDDVQIIYCLECGTELHAIGVNTCYYCDASENLVEGEYYNQELNRDMRGFFCFDIDTCLDRCIDQGRLPYFYKKTAELVK